MPGIFQDSLSFIIKRFNLGRILGLQSGGGGGGDFLLPFSLALARATGTHPLSGHPVESQEVHPFRCAQCEENVVQRLAGRLYLGQQAGVKLEILPGRRSGARLQVKVDGAGHSLLDCSLDISHLLSPQ